MNKFSIPSRLKKILLALACAASVAWMGSRAVGLSVPVRTESLGACVRNQTLFSATLGKSGNMVDAWSIEYHNRVRAIVNEHMAFLQAGGACLSENARPPAEPELQKLIDDLPSWKEKNNASQEDMSLALLDYLQEYECALQERDVVLEAAVFYDFVANKNSSSNANGTGLNLDAYDDEVLTQSRRVSEEKAVARDALDRTLLYLSGYARTWRLQHSLECLEGAMLDIRNALSLTADASACMPKIWDAQTFLRSIKTE